MAVGWIGWALIGAPHLVWRRDQQVPFASRKLAIGERIAFYRRQRGLTQQGLALRLDRSPRWLEKIEQGERPLTDIHVIVEVADALGVRIGALLGRPLYPEPRGDDDDNRRPVIPRLRRALLHYDGIHGWASGDEPIGHRTVPQLAAELEQTRQESKTNPRNFSAVAGRMPALLSEARQAVHDAHGTDEQRAAKRVLADMHRLTAMLLWQYGDDDLGWIAADRAITLAEQAEDPLLVAAGARTLQQLLLAQGHFDDVIDLADRAGATILPGPDAPPEQYTVWGSMQLLAAFAAARGQDPAEQRRLFAAAQDTAERLGHDRQDFGLNFGPTNVAIQQVGMLVELHDPTKAIRVGQPVPADRLPDIGRRAFHRIHLARAQFQRRKDHDAVALLLEAERVAPEIVLWESMTREMVRAMLRRSRQRHPALRELARRTGSLTE